MSLLSLLCFSTRGSDRRLRDTKLALENREFSSFRDPLVTLWLYYLHRPAPTPPPAAKGSKNGVKGK